MTQIDLTKLSGRTANLSVKPYGNHFEIQEDIGEGKAFKVAVIYRGGLLNENGARDRAYLFAAAPDMKDEIIALRDERDALTATNNALVDTVRELRAEVAELKYDALVLFEERNGQHAHAANLAGALENIFDITSDDTQTHISRAVVAKSTARAALAAYKEATNDTS